MMRFTKDQLDWIKENLDTGVFRNQTHFTNVFNAIFGVNITRQQMAEMLYRRGWRLKTFHNTPKWTGGMEEWLRGKYCECDCDFVRLAREFNETFGTDKSAGCITKFLERKGIHNPRPKKGQVNRGTFKKGMPHGREVGFNGVDAPILSSFCEFLNRTGFLTPKQKTLARKKLVKYNKQLTRLANA